MKSKLFLVFLGFIFSSCATVYVAKEKTYAKLNPKEAVVYFYRESMFQGSFTTYNVWTNEANPEKVGTLKNGSYFYRTNTPGKRTFFVNGEVRSALTIDLKPGQIYYVQCTINFGFWAARPKLSEVTENEALSKIKSGELDMTTLEAPPDARPSHETGY